MKPETRQRIIRILKKLIFAFIFGGIITFFTTIIFQLPPDSIRLMYRLFQWVVISFFVLG